MSSVSVVLPLERTRWFTDRDGAIATSKRYDEILRLSIDWTDNLESGETVSSVAYVDDGVTSSGASLASPVSVVTIAGTGEIEITATLSTGRKLQRVARFHGTDQNHSDY